MRRPAPHHTHIQIYDSLYTCLSGTPHNGRQLALGQIITHARRRGTGTGSSRGIAISGSGLHSFVVFYGLFHLS
jgi:hypothetical protein